MFYYNSLTLKYLKSIEQVEHKYTGIIKIEETEIYITHIHTYISYRKICSTCSMCSKKLAID